MEKIKRTYQEIGEFSEAARNYLAAHPADNTKFSYALNRTAKSANRVLTDYREKIDEINVKNCLAADDGKGEILRDDRGQYKFSKEGMLKRNVEVSKLMRSEVDLDVHFASDLPKELSASDKDNFLGFVIRDEEETKLEVVS